MLNTILKQLLVLINTIHDILNHLLESWMPGLTDKDLHFIIFGIIGLSVFILTDYIFKKLAKFNVSIISVIYTFTVLIVIVFSIEIEQKITKRGSMEFADIVAGLWGSIVLVGVYIILAFLFKSIYTSLMKRRHHR